MEVLKLIEKEVVRMKQGFLSEYFAGIAIKRLSSVEVDTNRSNQHEFNGSKPLRDLLGEERLSNYPATFVWFGGENEGITEEGYVTWYDARESHPTRWEYRLYFKSNPVMDWAQEGDLLVVAKRPDGELYMIVAESGTTLENQLLWLFNVTDQVEFRFDMKRIENENDAEIDFVTRYILEELGIEIADPDAGYLDSLLEPYLQKGFPTTLEFSSFARETMKHVSPVEEPDSTLIKWMEHEEKLFKRLERFIVAEKLEKGFSQDGSIDVESFIKFSLSVQNRRKSRVGYALENHLEEIFRHFKLAYSRNKMTENKSRPDFLFPGVDYYNDQDFPEHRLTMLGVKSTCKDRWRQVLSEAVRIKTKHLFTLEPGISENQTAEMQYNNLQLVLPKTLHETFTPDQQSWLMTLERFLELVSERQAENDS